MKGKEKTLITPATHSKQTGNAKRARTDGVDGSVTIAQNAFREIKPPDSVRLRDNDYPFWDAIILEYPKMEWTDHTLQLAAMLARSMYDLEREQFWMYQEGSLMEQKKRIAEKGNKAKGAKEIIIITNIVNPRARLIDQHTKNILAVRRSLSLHARGLNGEARDIAARRDAAKKIEGGVAGAADDDGLIARPKVH